MSHEPSPSADSGPAANSLEAALVPDDDAHWIDCFPVSPCHTYSDFHVQFTNAGPTFVTGIYVDSLEAAADRPDASPFLRCEGPANAGWRGSSGFTVDDPGVLRPGETVDVWYDYFARTVEEYWFDLPDMWEHPSRDFYLFAQVVFDGGETRVVAGPWRLICCSY
ncbi:MAG: hypothetical protein HY907_20830 [Deltaproteobacteria bacterium]|nr:hypothetical protein [Deltaproteobacteria bacterium]